MTAPSSTSQSDFFESLGMVTVSSGPFSELFALRKRMGSSGMGEPVSFAWST